MSARLLHVSELEPELWQRLIDLEEQFEELKQQVSCLQTQLAEQTNEQEN